MHPSFQKILSEIEVQRRKTLDLVRHLTPEQFNRSPEPGKWSVAQIMSHLIGGEKLSLSYLQKKIQGVEQAEDTGLWEEVKITLLKISQRLPGLKFKAPQRIVENTVLYPDFSTIEREWDMVRTEFKAFLEKIPNQFVNRRIYKHPRAGYLNVRHALIFFREHVIHHTPQLKKLL